MSGMNDIAKRYQKIYSDIKKLKDRAAAEDKPLYILVQDSHDDNRCFNNQFLILSACIAHKIGPLMLEMSQPYMDSLHLKGIGKHFEQEPFNLHKVLYLAKRTEIPVSGTRITDEDGNNIGIRLSVLADTKLRTAGLDPDKFNLALLFDPQALDAFFNGSAASSNPIIDTEYFAQLSSDRRRRLAEVIKECMTEATVTNSKEMVDDEMLGRITEKAPGGAVIFAGAGHLMGLKKNLDAKALTTIYITSDGLRDDYIGGFTGIDEADARELVHNLEVTRLDSTAFPSNTDLGLLQRSVRAASEQKRLPLPRTIRQISEIS